MAPAHPPPSSQARSLNNMYQELLLKVKSSFHSTRQVPTSSSGPKCVRVASDRNHSIGGSSHIPDADLIPHLPFSTLNVTEGVRPPPHIGWVNSNAATGRADCSSTPNSARIAFDRNHSVVIGSSRIPMAVVMHQLPFSTSTVGRHPGQVDDNTTSSTMSHLSRRGVASTRRSDAPPLSSKINHSKPRFPVRYPVSTARVTNRSQSDIDNGNKKSRPPTRRKKNPFNSHTHGISTSPTGDLTYSLNIPRHHSSPICDTQVPSNSKSPMSSDLISIPPPPPRRKSKPFKYSSPPPRSKINDSHSLLVEKLANSNMAPPLWKPVGNTPKNAVLAQLYPPPPRPSKQVDGTPAALARVYPKVRKATTQLKISNQENASDQARIKNSTTLSSNEKDTYIVAFAFASAPKYTHQEVSLSPKTGKKPNNAQGHTPLPNPSSKSHPSDHPIQENDRLDFSGYRRDYTLGETARSPSHMISELTPKRAAMTANSLSTHDYAFVKLSNGLFSYAILAFRSNAQENTKLGLSNNQSEECMTFVVNKSRQTKTIKKSKWGEYIRLVSKVNVCKDGSTATTISGTNKCTAARKDEEPGDSKYDLDVKSLQEIEISLNKLRTELYLAKGLWLPNTVSFDGDEDDGLVSCVSLPCELSN